MSNQKERLYLFSEHDSVIAGRMATQVGAKTRIIEAMEDVCGVDQFDCIAVYTVSGGRFPSKHLRIHPSPSHAAQDGHPIPIDLKIALNGIPYRCIALKRQSKICDKILALRLFHLHDDNGQWIGSRKKRRSRREAWLAAKRERAGERRAMTDV